MKIIEELGRSNKGRSKNELRKAKRRANNHSHKEKYRTSYRKKNIYI